LVNSPQIQQKELILQFLGNLKTQKNETVSAVEFAKNKAVLKIVETIKNEKESVLIEVLEIIKNQFNISSDDLAKLLMSNEILVPIEIFAERKLSLLQSLVKYLRENKNNTNKKISDLLIKDNRSIWLAYEKAKQRKAEVFTITKSELNVPLLIFKGKDSLLGPLVLYLKSLGFSNRNIAEKLNRGETTISTIYRRSLQKNG